MSDLPTPAQPRSDPMPEGEERAPPGTRAMSVVRWGLVALMALAAGGAWVHHLATAAGSRPAQGQWVCPMHPQILTEQKGECPICGMDLVPVARASPAKAGGPYTCPMHPAFVTSEAEARCPECHMKLVPREAPSAEGSVPGLVPVELSAERIQLMGMRTALARRQPLGTQLRAVGFVAPSENAMVSVTARFSGFVEAVAVQTGQRVEKGDVLATIYGPDTVAAQQAFLNALRWSDRRGGGQGAPGSADALERDARQRIEQLGIAPEDVDALVASGQTQRTVSVRAPVGGHVARRNVLKGLFVQSGQELFQIADLAVVWVLADIPENEIARIRVGQRSAFELASYPGERFSGRIRLVYPALNTGTRTLQARIELANRGLRLRPGMYGDVTIETGAREVVTVPAEAIVDTGEHRYVFVDRGGGRFEPRAVRPGASSRGRVAVLEGLA
ncbi:MAG TPA: efflux RND transporter periplasmic adaptor subunit, partial [Anaeromyxobacter sp.]